MPNEPAKAAPAPKNPPPTAPSGRATWLAGVLVPLGLVVGFLLFRYPFATAFYDARILVSILVAAGGGVTVWALDRRMRVEKMASIRSIAGTAAVILLLGVFMPTSWERGGFDKDIPAPTGYTSQEQQTRGFQVLCFYPCVLVYTYTYAGQASLGREISQQFMDNMNATGWTVHPLEEPNQDGPGCFTLCKMHATRNHREIAASMTSGTLTVSLVLR